MEKLSLVSQIVAHLEKKPRLAFNLLCFLSVLTLAGFARSMFNRGEVSNATNSKKDSTTILNLQSDVRDLRYDKSKDNRKLDSLNSVIFKMKDAHIIELQALNKALLSKSTRLESQIDR